MWTRSEALNTAGYTAPTRGGLHARKIRTLVVDDTPSMVEAICGLLELQELVEIVGRACDGIQAVKAVSELNPELVVMDVRMPRMDGFEAAGLLARQFPGTKVVLMSSEESPELREESRRCGADRFVFKLDFAYELLPMLRELFPEQGTCFIA